MATQNPIEHIKKKLQQVQRITKLMDDVTGHTEYRWFQGTEPGVFSQGGICHGMSFDWLRRKFLNKRNYNDPKYASAKDPGNFSVLTKLRDFVVPEKNPKRVSLMLKAGEVQSGFYQKLRENREGWRAAIQTVSKTRNVPDDQVTEDDIWGINPNLVNPSDPDLEQKILARFAFQRIRENRTGLAAIGDLSVFSIPKGPEDRVCAGKSEIADFVLEAIGSMLLEPASASAEAGLTISFEDSAGKVNGHATALYWNRKDSHKTYVYFDPNFGEFHWESPKKCATFVAELWDISYSHLKRGAVRMVTYRPPGS